MLKVQSYVYTGGYNNAELKCEGRKRLVRAEGLYDLLTFESIPNRAYWVAYSYRARYIPVPLSALPPHVLMILNAPFPSEY